MNGNDIINAMEHINDKYIAEFADTSQWKKKRNFWLSPKFYGSIAAIVTNDCQRRTNVCFTRKSL